MFGKITITYDPPNNDPDESRVSMQFSSEADLNEIVRNFERFLRVMEYPLDHGDSLEVVYAKDCPDTPAHFTAPPSPGKYSYLSWNDGSLYTLTSRDMES